VGGYSLFNISHRSSIITKQRIDISTNAASRRACNASTRKRSGAPAAASKHQHHPLAIYQSIKITLTAQQ